MLLFYFNNSFFRSLVRQFNDAVILVVQAVIYKSDMAAACDRGFFPPIFCLAVKSRNMIKKQRLTTRDRRFSNTSSSL